MSKIALAAGIAVVAAGAAAFIVQHRSNQALRRDVAGLREEVRVGIAAVQANPARASLASESTTLVAHSGGASNVAADDLVKLREEIAALRKSSQVLTEFAQMAQASAALKSLGGTETSIATKLTPAEALKNAGKSTPEAATETVLWAAFAGDVDALSNSVVFTPTAREKADAWFAGLSDSTRQQYGSPEKVIALMIARDAAGLSGMQVLGQKEIAPDNVGVRIRFGSTDGKTKDDNLLMRRGSDGWRMVLPDNAVEKFARQLSGKK
jgi:hypothetical protein